MSLRFDAEKHQYFLTHDGVERRVPGVTEVIRTFAPYWDCGQWYLDRGTAVHAAVALAVNNALDWSTVDERIVGRVKSILRFIEDNQLSSTAIEAKLISTRYRFAGTLDYLGYIEDRSCLILCDWKGTIDRAAEVQVAAYTMLWNENAQDGFVTKAVLVECQDAGDYRCEWLDFRALKRRQSVFLNMLSVYNWRK